MVSPLIIFSGIITLICFLLTATIAVMNRKGINKIPMTWHLKMAIVSIVIAIIHMIMAIATFF